MNRFSSQASLISAGSRGNESPAISPSPLPSPEGGETIAACRSFDLGSLGRSLRGGNYSFSLRERAGVRGIGASIRGWQRSFAASLLFSALLTDAVLPRAYAAGEELNII